MDLKPLKNGAEHSYFLAKPSLCAMSSPFKRASFAFSRPNAKRRRLCSSIAPSWRCDATLIKPPLRCKAHLAWWPLPWWHTYCSCQAYPWFSNWHSRLCVLLACPLRHSLFHLQQAYTLVHSYWDFLEGSNMLISHNYEVACDSWYVANSRSCFGVAWLSW